jgi:hypothetical protein
MPLRERGNAPLAGVAHYRRVNLLAGRELTNARFADAVVLGYDLEVGRERGP